MSCVEEIAVEFGFDVQDLRDHLAHAKETHDLANHQAQHRAELRKLAEAPADKFLDIWTTVSDDTRLRISHEIDFMNPDAATESISRAQSVAKAAIEDFNFMAGKGRSTQLFALRVFAILMKQYWESRCDERFGCRFREDGKFVGPCNPASKFFCACVAELDAEYSNKNAEAVMKFVQKGETPTRVKADEYEPSASDIRDALESWSRR